MLKNIELRDYQKRILDELAGVAAIGLFLKTGSGKTYTSLARAIQNPTQHLLVICPQKIITQWQKEIVKTTDYQVWEYRLKATSKEKNKQLNEYYAKYSDKQLAIVLNFDIISRIDLDFINENWTIIVDESHKIKSMYKLNRKRQVSHGKVTHKVLELGKKTDYKIILTATPAEKNWGGYIDYYTQLSFLGYLNMSYWAFRNRYCLLTKMQLPGMPFPVENIAGYRMDLIDKEIKPILTATCRFYAPKYHEYDPQLIKIDIEKTKSYNQFLKNRVYQEITIKNSSAFRIAKMTLTSGDIMGSNEYQDPFVYRDNTSKAEWLEELLSNTDDVVSVLYNFNVEREIIKEICEKLGKRYVVIDGSIADKPAELQKEFDVIIGQFKAFGESLDGVQDLCHIMVYYALPESSEQYQQSLGRIDRIGQTEMPIYYFLVMEKTIDELIYQRLQQKLTFTSRDLDALSINY